VVERRRVRLKCTNVSGKKKGRLRALRLLTNPVVIAAGFSFEDFAVLVL
jgi:hypothetical protein